jgi:tight adherence protein B
MFSLVAVAMVCGLLAGFAFSVPDSTFRLRPAPSLQISTPSRLQRRPDTLEPARIFTSGLIAELRSGRTVADALQAAREDSVSSSRGPATLMVSGVIDLAAMSRTEDPWLRRIGIVLGVSEETGASAIPALEAILDSLTDAQDLARTVATEVAAPRLTALLLAALPLFSWAAGSALGASPVRWLTGSAIGWLVLLVGLALNIAGVVWIHRLASSVRA